MELQISRIQLRFGILQLFRHFLVDGKNYFKVLGAQHNAVDMEGNKYEFEDDKIVEVEVVTHQ